MATLSFSEVPKLQEGVGPYGYRIHLHDACGGQSFTLERTDGEASGDVYAFLESFFAERQMAVRFYDAARLEFTVR